MNIPNGLDTSALLSDVDSSETHGGVTWVWFHAVGRWGKKTVAGFRVVTGSAAMAKPCHQGDQMRADEVLEFASTWARIAAFRSANEHVTWEDY